MSWSHRILAKPRFLVFNEGVMKRLMTLALACFTILSLVSCSSFLKPKGWPLSVEPRSEAIAHMTNHVKFTGSGIRLTHQEKALLTFLNDDSNIAAAIGKKNKPGAHLWSAAEVYRVDPGKHVSVLCENGYHQDSLYFHYDEAEKTWFRVNHLGEQQSRGVAAVVVK